jgi:hypothetical protein
MGSPFVVYQPMEDSASHNEAVMTRSRPLVASGTVGWFNGEGLPEPFFFSGEAFADLVGLG